MLFDSLVTIGGVVVGIITILVLVYIILSAEQRNPAGDQAQGRYPVTNEELLALTSAIYPYPEYSYFPALAFSTEPQAVVQATPPMLHSPVLSLYRERQEAIQPA